MANVFNKPAHLAANRETVQRAAAVGMQPQDYLFYIETNPEFIATLHANNLSMVSYGQRMSSRVRRAVEVFDPSPPPPKRQRVEPSPPPVVDATTLGSALIRLRAISHTSEFLAANEPLYPVPLRTYSDDDPFLRTPGPPLNVFFDNGLTEVCESVFGPRLTRRLITAFSQDQSKLSIRNFFEIDNPGRQCVGVFATEPERSPIHTHCWICGTRTRDDEEYPKECEHKFPILPALLVTGLYDSRLQRALGDQRANDYKALLRSEYAYAHRRCNRVKSDSVFARLRYTEGGNKTVTCVPAPDIIMATLSDTRTRDAATFTPQRADLEGKIRREPAWDGRDTTRALTIPAWGEARGMDAWDADRARHVAASVNDAAAKFNEKNLSAKTARLHIVNALLTRAINLVPELVKEELWSSLTDAGRAAVTRALGSRGGRRRRTRRAKHQRGGGQEDDEVLGYILRARVKEYNLKKLARGLKSNFKNVKNPDEYSAIVIQTIEEYIKLTDDRVTDTLSKLTPESLDDLLFSVETEEEDGSEAAAPAPAAAAAALASASNGASASRGDLMAVEATAPAAAPPASNGDLMAVEATAPASNGASASNNIETEDGPKTPTGSVRTYGELSLAPATESRVASQYDTPMRDSQSGAPESVATASNSNYSSRVGTPRPVANGSVAQVLSFKGEGRRTRRRRTFRKKVRTGVKPK